MAVVAPVLVKIHAQQLPHLAVDVAHLAQAAAKVVAKAHV